MQITENTPDTTSVIRWNCGLPEANRCITAKVPPATRAAGHTSNPSFHVAPSILTKATMSQNGTRIETQGNWRPAIADKVN